ncbi:Probable arabinosyltransferase A [Mycobacteroides abscessus]|uniref:arabinosyltransferase domain-containing protein n=1 Tax=Mycobacteroides abscessus TaxID=36809 RepID=UPI0002E98B42|nr:arabinosyltransferase domain-containing protein [Mycobacteroides abscessus]CPT69175.1 Probable arabinosyltransferase A [Mycobacteroides abscessus]CPU60760.1 Probable arabinosyltransferase A [Mycobacteroides abscessus]SKK43243.1 Probable arabinosyltransferase A [Mycobacteroides abscessus subsp. massiliense]SKP58816.1 arabinosyltransferase A [Mycobacteroides abscessus subsp. massiliense]SKV88478.1 Probable arabinosyltransferase A [Mycobacteroides abscessus subsp. massiliense]
MPSQLSQSATAGTAQRARLISLAAATIGVLLCVLVPLLPVRQSTVDINWPQGAGADGNITSITAPLVSGAPLSFEAHIPCTAVATLPASGGVVLSTSPDGGFEASRHALFVRATTDLVVVAFRDNVATVAPRKAVESGGCTTLDIWANAGGVGANFAGLPNAIGTLSIENKPQVTGLFTDLKVPAAGGPTAHVVVDTRFISSPTTLKLAAMVLGIGAVAIAIAALAVLERGGRKLPRKPFRLPGRATLLTNGVADTGVVGTLLLWHVIGAITSDDGNVLVEARVAHQAGYVAEYYRYFGATASPFDWYATLLSWLTQVSTVGVWMRVPATLAGIGTWYILRKKMLPRLGEQLAASRTAVWTAALVFLTAWLPFNNGLRPEPIIVFGTVLTWILVERAIATRRLSPAALAIVVALLAATVAPQGLIALGPLLAGGRAIARVVAVRRLRYGRFTPIAVLAASVAGVLAFTFRDQTLATVAESARIKYVVGPTIAWYQEFLRYYFLTVESNVDGSLTRRIAVFILLLCLFGTLAVLLRRGVLPGLASGPVWRLIGSTAIGLLLLTFTPTKWAIQFGIFAGLSGALGAVAAFTFARVGLHSRRNLALYVTALLFILAWSTSGINGWFYVGNYGVPWFDKQPVIASHPVTNMFLVLSVITALIAGWLHFRLDYAGHTEVENTRRNRLLASTPLMIVAAIMVILEVTSMAKGVYARSDTYTTGKANLLALTGSDPCAMASDVLVEPDANEGLLQPIPGQQAGKYGPLGGLDPVGFVPDGVRIGMTSLPVVGKPGLVNSDASPNAPIMEVSDGAGTTGGVGPTGINGSSMQLPFGLDPARTPVMGSYGENSIAAHLKSSWYELPPPSPDRPLVVISAAGAIWSFQQDGTFSPEINYGQQLKLEWGVRDPRSPGGFKPLRQDYPIDIGPQTVWRNLRFPTKTAPPGANVVRIVADDPNLSSDQWLAFTPPRVPTLKTAQDLLGSDTPVLLDMAVAQNFPCQRPFSEHLGVAELPKFRVMPEHKQVATSSNMWMSAEDGGPFMFTTALLRTSSVPTYLRNDWYRDWGSIEKYEPIVAPNLAPDAQLTEGTVVVNGWTRKGPIRALP